MKKTFKFQKEGRQGGFTLIELMIAIAIVGILASIAVPAFSNYLGRARISEAVNYAEGCKTGFLEYYSTNGSFPTTNVQANCPSITTDNVQSVTVGNDGIVVQLSTKKTIPSAARSKFIYLQPLTNANVLAKTDDTIVSWACSIADNGKKALPATSNAYDVVPAICRNSPK